MNITPVNNYNNKVSFRHLLPNIYQTYQAKDTEMLKNILSNPEIIKFIKHYQDLGIDIYIGNYTEGITSFSRQICSEIQDKFPSITPQYATVLVYNNILQEFNAEIYIEKLENEYQKIIEKMKLSNVSDYILMSFNHDLK